MACSQRPANRSRPLKFSGKWIGSEVMLKRRSLLELVEGKIEATLVEPKIEKEKSAGQLGPHYFQHSKSPNGIATSFENALISINLLRIECSYDIFDDRIHV